MGIQNTEPTCTNLYDRVKKLLVSFEWSDCCFSICGKGFKAHKLLLAISSPVFEAMFYGPLSTTNDVVITDIEPDIFQLLLNFIYTDSVSIISIEEAFELLYAANKYLVDPLSDICLKYIKQNMSIDNVVTVLNYPEYMRSKELTESALTLFCEHANFMLQEKFKQITINTMKMILTCHKMNISEKALICHVYRWIRHYCLVNNVPLNMEEIRKLLINNGILKLLRFCTLTLGEFDDITDSTNNILLSSEVEQIKKKITDIDNVESLVFLANNRTPRHPLELTYYLCHRISYKTVGPINIAENNNKIQTKIKASKSVFITGLVVPARLGPDLHYNNPKIYSEHISISVTRDSDKNVIAYTNFMATAEYNAVNCLEFSEPCLFRVGQTYTVILSWPIEDSFCKYMTEYRENICRDFKVTFEFGDCLENGGSFIESVNYYM